MRSRKTTIAAALTIALLTLLLSGCESRTTSSGSDGIYAHDACASASVGGIAGFQGTFTMDGRPATEQEIEDRISHRTPPGASDAGYEIHVKNVVSQSPGVTFTAQLNPNCALAAQKRGRK